MPLPIRCLSVVFFASMLSACAHIADHLPFFGGLEDGSYYGHSWEDVPDTCTAGERTGFLSVLSSAPPEHLAMTIAEDIRNETLRLGGNAAINIQTNYGNRPPPIFGMSVSRHSNGTGTGIAIAMSTGEVVTLLCH